MPEASDTSTAPGGVAGAVPSPALAPDSDGAGSAQDAPLSKGSTMPAKYRKKPVVIEAALWDGTPEGATPLIDWMLGAGERSARFHNGVDDLCIKIDTLEGTITASPGDWIIRGVQGEFYPCKPDIFEATYEP
jgi:hypothetical protein